MKNPQKPTMLYDGDCGFCMRHIQKWKKKTGDKVDYLPYQQNGSDYPQVTKQQCEKAVQLIMPEGKVYSGAHAVFHALRLASKYRRMLWLYEHFPLFDRFSEGIYQLIARHRSFFSGLVGRTKRCRIKM